MAPGDEGCFDGPVADVRTARLQLHAVDVAEGDRIVARTQGPDDSWASDFPFEGDVRAVGGFIRATSARGEQRPSGYYRIAVNGNDGNAVEVTPTGMQIDTRTIDPIASAGDLFGLAVAPGGRGLLCVDDNGDANTLDLLH